MSVDMEIVTDTLFGGSLAYAYPGDAGLDIYVDEDVELEHDGIYSAATGIRVAIPDGCVGLVVPRSGKAAGGLTVVNSPGIIDSGYRGELRVLLHNVSGRKMYIQAKDKIAQLVLVPFISANIVEVEEFSASETSRGVGGFGSSGR